MPRLVTAGIVFLGVVVAGASATWCSVQRSLPITEMPVEVAQLERALALPGLIGLGAVNVQAIVQLKELAGDASPENERAGSGEGSWVARLGATGLDVLRDAYVQVLAGGDANLFPDSP